MGSYSVKCVEVAETETGVELCHAAILPVGQEADIKKVLESLELSSKPRIRVALSGPSVIIRRISMPLLNSRELQTAIRFEAESHIPFSIDDCVLDYQILRQDAAKKEMSIMLAAAKRDLVESRYKLLSGIGVYPEIVDLDIFCLVNAFEMLNSVTPEKNYGLLNIGHKISSFAIIHDGVPALVREISLGGIQVTKVLAETKSISETQADEFKIKKPSGEDASLKAAVEKGFESLSEEISNSIDYVENEIKEELKMVYVSGGGALSPGTLEVLAEEVGRPVSYWDNTKKMRLAAKADQQFIKEHSAELTVALGMALRGPGVVKK